ncbi:hypothetical protein LL912_22290 [Niabella sp. CC-SYL272]|uniref:hypothetical protein n=1 Tax=Niabella agricola TaxID=2891571 RepID=UPI001F3B4E8E|nr:hypothetical protein [Niabella agricola]MCF3111533.1 hypothetical protein [Niabella agricola]
MKKVFLLCGLLCLHSLNTHGQDMLTATIANIAIHDFQRERIRSEYEQGKILRKSSQNSNEVLKAIRPGRSFLFEPDAAVSAIVKRSIIDDLKKKNPGSGNNLEVVLKRNNPLPAYAGYLKNIGLDVQHNYADAFSAYLLGMWRIANGQHIDPSAMQINAVRNQVACIIDVAGWSHRKKQEAAEYLLYDLVFANEPYEGARRAGNKMQQLQDSDMVYYRFLRQHKMDLRKMTVTRNGLVSTN